MRENAVKQKLMRREPSVGATLPWPSPQLVELCGLAGFEWVLMDAEHGPIDVRVCEEMVRASESVGVVPMVRVPTNDRIVIMSYLQVGVLGIAVPHVNSAEEAKRVVEAVKYFPEGSRYADTGARAADYGLLQPNTELYAEANRQTLIVVWVEEIEAIRNLPAILQVEGIDAVNIGPSDLALTMGHPGRPDHPEVQRVIEQAKQTILASGKALVGETRDADGVPSLLDSGALLISTSAKHLCFYAMQGYLERYRQYVSARSTGGSVIPGLFRSRDAL